MEIQLLVIHGNTIIVSHTTLLAKNVTKLIRLLTTLLLWLEFHYRMLGFLEKVLTDFALHGLPW